MQIFAFNLKNKLQEHVNIKNIYFIQYVYTYIFWSQIFAHLKKKKKRPTAFMILSKQ